MIKWDLILGEETFFQHYHLYRNHEKQQRQNANLKAIINQHHVVLTSDLRTKYEDYFFEHGEDDYDSLVTFFDELPSYEDDIYMYIKVPTEEDDTLEDLLKKIAGSSTLQNPLVVCDSGEQYRHCLSMIKEKKLFIVNKLLDIDISNRIYRNSVIFSKDMRPEDYDDFLAWLSDVFKGEHSIDIIDPYFGSHRGLENFLTNYIPRIANGTKINIYSMFDDTPTPKDWKDFDTAIQAKKLTMYLHNVSRINEIPIHERRIYLNPSKTHIAIGHGLDSLKAPKFADHEHGKMLDCHITIDKDMSWLRYFEQHYSFSDFKY